MNKEVGVVICSRVNSSRLSRKPLREIQGKPIIEILLRNVLRQKEYDVVLAIPESSADDELETIGREIGVQIFRGFDDSPLHRLHAVAHQFGFKHIVRITHDDILIDAQLMENQVRHHLNEKSTRGPNDYTWMSKCPEGVAGEVISRRALDEAVRAVGKKPVEHVSYYVRNPEKFRCSEYYPPRDYHFQFRLTIDYEQDLLLVKILYSMLAQPFSTLDITNLLKSKNNRHLLEINRMPDVTIYTCCHNQARFLPDCLDSVKAQSWADWELIIIDDASTDETPQVILDWLSQQSDEIKRRVRVHRNKQNKGLPGSSNRAIGMARGRYIARVDSDDVLDPEYVYRCKTEIEENRSWCAVFTGYERTDINLTPIGRFQNDDYHPGCAFFRSAALKEVLYKDGLHHYEGLDFIRRFKKHFEVGTIPDALWRYRKHTESKSYADTVERAQAREAILNTAATVTAS